MTGIYASGYYSDPRLPLPLAALASQKIHKAIYLMCIYDYRTFAAGFGGPLE